MYKRVLRSAVVLVAAYFFSNQLIAQNLKINEIMASNQTGEWDDFFEYDDWIEIYNSGPITNLAGYYLTDDPDSLDKWLIPSTNLGVTAILPNNHLIFWLDKDPEQGEDHVDFRLSGDGETVMLVDPDGVTIIDQITFPLMADDISYGRVTDGAADWQYFNNVTFDAPNGEIAQSTQVLFINEVQTNNVSTYDDLMGDFDQWFEIYNPNNFQVNVAGYYVSINGNPTQFLIPNTNPYRTVIPANGFILIWCDNEPLEDSNHTDFTLSTSGGTIVLTGPDATTTVDSYTYSAMAADASYGRSSDGSPSSIIFNEPTPRVSNTLILIEPALVYINEIMAANQNDVEDNAGEKEDWIEIYNPNNFDVNLSGYYLSDNPDNPMKWQIPSTYPDSVTVEANSWMLFYPDEDMTQGVLHASFRLSNNGEWLGLYSQDGYSLADEIEWAHIDPDTSYGRITDGNESWWMFTGTTPDASNNEGVLNVDEEEQDQFMMAFYPNPANDIIYFRKPTDFVLYSADGRLLKSVRNITSYDISDLSNGVYLIRSGNTSEVLIKN
jgi:hypothetical protein